MKQNFFKLFEYDNYSELLNVWIALGVCDRYLTIESLLTQRVIDYNTPIFLLDKLTVLASIPRIRIKMIILAPVEMTWAHQQSNIYFIYLTLLLGTKHVHA